jgi:DNA-binding GntR family transcriptional regulator
MAMTMSRTLPQQVVAELKARILSGKYKPGERLPERHVCAELGISRTPLREAIRALAVEGLVVISPNCGARVSRLTRAQAEQVLQIIEALEALAGELACSQMSNAEISEFVALHYLMRAAYERGDRDKYYEFNRALHEAIVRGSGNGELIQLYASMNARIAALRYLGEMSESEWADGMRDHEKILEVLQARNAKAIGSLLRTHLRDKFTHLVRSGFVDQEDEDAVSFVEKESA